MMMIIQQVLRVAAIEFTPMNILALLAPKEFNLNYKLNLLRRLCDSRQTIDTCGVSTDDDDDDHYQSEMELDAKHNARRGAQQLA